MSWTRGPTVGRGSSAAVSVAAALGSGEVFAVKSAEASRSESLRRERAILSELDCPHVVAYRGWDVTREAAGGGTVCNLLMEYAPAGTLADAARRGRGGRLGEPAVRWCARGILRGLEYVHGRGVAHCDIKGQNILVTGEGPKIADFGLARRVGDAAGPVGGTPLFMAPEVARGGRPGFAADVWSLGCTVLEIATGRPPWADVADPVSAIHRIGFSGEAPEIPGFLSEQCRDFLSKCLRRDPSERWSATELLGHPFLEEEEEEEAEEAPEFLSEEAGTKIPDTKSPTSVLEQAAIWSSTENSEHSHPLLQRSPLNRPPGERIRQLIGEWSANSISPPRMPNWETDESWVTVRSSESSKEAPETSRRANADANEGEEDQEDQEDQEVEEVVVGSCRNGDPENGSDWERKGDDDSTPCGCSVLGSCEIAKFVGIELENCRFFALHSFTSSSIYPSIWACFFFLSCLVFLAKKLPWEPVAFASLSSLDMLSFFFILSFGAFDGYFQECSFFGSQIHKKKKKKSS
ncbi:hypothetical protein BT93_E2606 [Corymbia citriodora subsp. variegata]|nr:hypothetical protein BT93_E2606 [Corymbia citriodora subsp. variegata]